MELYSGISILKNLIKPMGDENRKFKGRIRTSFWIYSNLQVKSLRNKTSETIYNQPIYKNENLGV